MGFGVHGFGFWVLGFGLRIEGFEFRIWGFSLSKQEVWKVENPAGKRFQKAIACVMNPEPQALNLTSLIPKP